MLSELFASVTAKVAAASFAAVTTVGTGAAAATGHLPGELQDRAAAVAENFDIDLPDSDEADAQDTERQDGDKRQDEGRQDDVNSQDGEGTDTDDAVLDTLSGDSELEPGDEGFGDAVSDNAESGDLGDEVSGTATETNEGANNSDDAATGDDAANNSDGAATTGDDDSDNEYRENAPSESGEQDDPEYDEDNNPGETRPE